MNFLYINNTAANLSDFHNVIVAAIAAGGSFPDDYADLLSLTNLGPLNSDGSNRWAVDFI